MLSAGLFAIAQSICYILDALDEKNAELVIDMPPYLEQITAYKGQLLCIFESGSKQYAIVIEIDGTVEDERKVRLLVGDIISIVVNLFSRQEIMINRRNRYLKFIFIRIYFIL